MQKPLFPDPDRLAELCRRHGIRRLALFGSALHGTDRPGSDVDLLVEFAPQRLPGLLGLAAIELELSGLLGGRPRLDGRTLDLRTPEDLSRHFRDDVLRAAAVQYAA